MSSILTISKPAVRAPIITILSPAGLGKTSLAALFPDPIFIRTEDGMESIPEDRRPDAYPIVSEADDLFKQLQHVMRSPHRYKTLVLDSVTPLDAMFIADVIKKDPKNPRTINQALGGFGSGMKAVGGLHQKVRAAFQYLNEKRGMAIVVLAHSTIERIDPPDTEGYSRYSMRLSKESLAPWVDQVDLVGFIQLDKFLVGEEGQKKKARSSGERVLSCYATAANESKNRYGITGDIDLPEHKNPLLELIPYYKLGLHEHANPERPKAEAAAASDDE